MHIPPFDNQNKAIIDIHDAHVPLTYFNIVKLEKGQVFSYQIPGYETCIVPATGRVDVDVDTTGFGGVGNRGSDVWDGEPEGVYVPTDMPAQMVCTSDSCEVFVAGARFDDRLTPLLCTKMKLMLCSMGLMTPKRIGRSNIFWVKNRWIRLGVCWSQSCIQLEQEAGQASRLINMTLIVFQTRPGMMRCIISDLSLSHGFGMQLLEPDEDKLGEAFHIVDGSSFAIKSGYHPCVVAPGYEMYYFTILGGLSQRSLVQYFQPEHAWQLETIPGIKDMIAKFK